MKELEQILELWNAAQIAGESAVLATVVKTRGSSYRLPGARLLLTSDGRRAGSISGGCLEDDLIKKAFWLTESGPLIKRYDTTPEGEIDSGGYGLGCNGIIHVLLERVTSDHHEILELIRDVRSQRRPAVIAHVVDPPTAAGQRFVIKTDGAIWHNVEDSDLAEALEKEARAASSLAVRINDPEVFVETLAPPLRLLVFGAGDDAVPLTELSKFLGWSVSVLDGRAHYARRDKFPAADEVTVRSHEQPATPVPIDPWTVAVLMSHSYSQDLRFLRELSSQPLRYLGILGPRKRAVQLLSDAGLDPARLSPALHSPMGLDIGADGPRQVALSVIAEIQAIVNGRGGGLLRERAGSIHAGEDGPADPETFWVQSIACA